MDEKRRAEDRRIDSHGERLARIEEGIKSLGRSLDTLRENFEDHTKEKERLEKSVADIQKEIASVKGGYAMFWKMCGVIGLLMGGVWAVATWVAGHGKVPPS